MRLLEPLAPKWLKLFPLVNFKRCKTISNSWLNEFFFTSQVHKWGFWCLLCKVEAPVGSIILLKHDQTKHSQQHVIIVSIFKSSKNRVSNLPTKKQRVQNFDSSNNSKIFFFHFPYSWRIGRLWLWLSLRSAVSMTEPSTLMLSMLSVVLCALIILMTSIQSACSTVWFLRNFRGEKIKISWKSCKLHKSQGSHVQRLSWSRLCEPSRLTRFDLGSIMTICTKCR